MKGQTLEERFWSKVQKSSGCWNWIGAISSGGYGAFGLNKKVEAAHRIAYTLCKGEISKGLMILHSCDNPLCVNPAHLSMGTHDDNMRDKTKKQRGRSQNTNKLFCKRGHAFSSSNTKLKKNGKRECKLCNKIRRMSAES